MSEEVKCGYCGQEFQRYDNTYMNHIEICQSTWENSHQDEIREIFAKYIDPLSEEQWNKILFGR